MQIQEPLIQHFSQLTKLYEEYLMFYNIRKPEKEISSFIQARIIRRESLVWICIDDQNDEVLGFVNVYPHFSTLTLGSVWILNDLFVKESGRGKGIGKALILKVLEEATKQEIRSVHLETHHENHAAQKLYHSLNFKLNRHFLHYDYSV